MKSFAPDEKPIDIEELFKLKCLNSKTKNTPNPCQQDKLKNVHIIKDSLEWYSPNNMDDLFTLLVEYSPSAAYRIVSGNTGVGVFKSDGPYQVFIDIKSIAELYSVSMQPSGLTIGAQVSLKTLIDVFNQYSSMSGFEYLSELAEHVSKVANSPVRNAASWAGNLIMKYNHQDFPSDLYVILETVGAVLDLVGPNKFTPSVQATPYGFSTLPSINGKLIYNVSINFVFFLAVFKKDTEKNMLSSNFFLISKV